MLREVFPSILPSSNLLTHLHVCDDLLEEAAEGRALLVHGRQVHRGQGHGGGRGGGETPESSLKWTNTRGTYLHGH